MKKVWVLEKFETVDHARKIIDEMIEMAENKKDMSETDFELIKQVVKNQQIKIQENPDGWWYGFEGKERYPQFIETATKAIRRNPGEKFRVVRAEIDDKATTWLGYENAVENEGVLNFLLSRA